ncbi:DKNYY domain-containing protein [Patescibacteria group bacterium]|nr:DKNYY domain-containing protein [Patescibacteria group bacterium]MBU1519717.1 DKNYY domain-containing protein [Patescibacteria group bacterium]MBU2416615.1 DKNYY domain-containing protein [Patescibacteria group bacterium]MBU2460930.1 DKNYY domain-containing protein [Patescibacteria group bacterium]
MQEEINPQKLDGQDDGQSQSLYSNSTPSTKKFGILLIILLLVFIVIVISGILYFIQRKTLQELPILPAEIYELDKNSTVSEGIKLEECEINQEDSFYYCIENNIIYYSWEGKKELLGIDSATFQVLNYFYAKDKNHVWCGSKTLTEADLATFQSLGDEYAKDKNNVYNNGNIIEGVDPADCTEETPLGCIP